MRSLPPWVRGVLLGIAAVAAVLLLADLAGELRGAPGAEVADGPLRWAMVVELGIGAVVALTVWAGRKDVTIPVVAALLLAWPALSVLVPAVGGPPSWVPLLGNAAELPGLLLVVGVLATGAALTRR